MIRSDRRACLVMLAAVVSFLTIWVSMALGTENRIVALWSGPSVKIGTAAQANIVAEQVLMGGGGSSETSLDTAKCDHPDVRPIDWPPGSSHARSSLYLIALACEFHTDKGRYTYTNAKLDFGFDQDTHVLNVYPDGSLNYAGERNVGIDSMLNFHEAPDLQNRLHWREIYQFVGSEAMTTGRATIPAGVSWSLDFGATSAASTPIRQTGLVLVEVPTGQRTLRLSFSFEFTLANPRQFGRTAKTGLQSFETSLPEAVDARDSTMWSW